MITLQLKGRITENGELEIQLPAGLPSGEVTVQIGVPDEQSTWTDAEIRDLMNQPPMSRADFIAWLAANPPLEPWGNLKDDEDAGDYVHRMRRPPGLVQEVSLASPVWIFS